MRRLLSLAVIALLSGCAAFVAATLLGTAAVFVTPFVANFPAPDPLDSTDFGRGILMGLVGVCVFAVALVPLWIACFKYLWKRRDAALSIAASRIDRIARDV